MVEILQAGWNPTLDIPSALGRLADDQLSGRFVLVSMIDSTPNVCHLPSFVPLLDDLGAFHAVVDDDVVIEAQTLLALVDDHDFLAGFDEIWLCDEIPRSGKPGDFRLTSEVRLGSESPPGMAQWMLRAPCRAGLGDGDGLNFATFDDQLAGRWR